MRCFALAEEAASRHINSYFFMPEANPAVLQRLASIGAQWQLAQAEPTTACASLSLTSNDWWVVDSYDADARFLAKLHEHARVLVFDDLCALPYYACDLIVNASSTASQLPYARQASNARLLAGPSWSPVRKEFRAARRIRDLPASQSLSLMLGGSDARGLTPQIAMVLREHFPNHHLHLVLGPAFGTRAQLEEMSGRLGGITMHHNSPALAQLLASVDVVVTAAGGSIGELCALRQMAIVLVVVDNQAGALQSCPYPVVDARRELPECALVRHVAEVLDRPATRQRIADAAHALVDGHGCQRILNAMLES